MSLVEQDDTTRLLPRSSETKFSKRKIVVVTVVVGIAVLIVVGIVLGVVLPNILKRFL